MPGPKPEHNVESIFVAYDIKKEHESDLVIHAVSHIYVLYMYISRFFIKAAPLVVVMIWFQIGAI